MHQQAAHKTAPDHPWVVRLAILVLLAAAFGGWWWLMQRTLANEREALSGRLEGEARTRFERALRTVEAGLVRDLGEAVRALGDPLDPAKVGPLVEQGLISACLLPEGRFAVIEGVVPDAAVLASGEIHWGSDESGRDPVVSALLGRIDEAPVRAALRARLFGSAGPPLKASFRHRSIERFLENVPDPVLADLAIAEAARAAGGLPASGVSKAIEGGTLWWSERQLEDRFEQAGVGVTLGDNGQRFTPWPSSVRAELVPTNLGDTAFRTSTTLVHWVGLGSGLLFAAAVGGALWAGWRDRRIARLRTDLSASFAHELRTPLAGQRLLIESLLGGLGQDPEKRLDYLKRILGSNQRLGSLAEQFLTFSRLDRGVLRIERSETSILELVNEILDSRQQPFDECLVDIPDDLRAAIDRGAVASILGNLIENAWKYTRGPKWIALRARRDGNRLELEVEDRGIGFDPGQKRKAFRQFWRAETGLDRRVDGLGLGLTIVARLAEAHGGRVELESEAGRGSTFRVILPESDP
jgi:signal transduction histidine kinase